MSMVAAISNVQIPFTVDVITQGGTIAAVSLVVSLSIALLVSDSKYWNKWASSTLNICTSSLLITFAAIVLLKIIMLV
ncbi:MAG: hypothetical protein OIN86_15660 [Candidatus Methanoperedens sp.]|nr:hypothetical protein [Candidatus Methanoperedens sp.]CAG0956481.1 hypothetical protein METP1_00473 [Methanosarcinales archaeon]